MCKIDSVRIATRNALSSSPCTRTTDRPSYELLIPHLFSLFSTTRM
jgi:hypothetical protein